MIGSNMDRVLHPALAGSQLLDSSELHSRPLAAACSGFPHVKVSDQGSGRDSLAAAGTSRTEVRLGESSCDNELPNLVELICWTLPSRQSSPISSGPVQTGLVWRRSTSLYRLVEQSGMVSERVSQID